MNREEVLAKAQSEGNGRDIADLEAQKKGAYIAYLIGMFLIVVINIVEWIIMRHINNGGNLVVFVMATIAFSVKYRTLRKKHELFVALVYGLGAIFWLVMWILELCGEVH